MFSERLSVPFLHHQQIVSDDCGLGQMLVGVDGVWVVGWRVGAAGGRREVLSVAGEVLQSVACHWPFLF